MCCERVLRRGCREGVTVGDRPVRLTRSILVGATGTNAGKTEFATRLIGDLAQREPVHAVKVTTIYDTGGSCARGGKGCGVCTRMPCEMLLEEEPQSDRELTGRDKDTTRMLRAGAQRVWWLRVREEALAEAPAALANLVPESGVLVIESNAIRRVVEPDLFFMVCGRAVAEGEADPRRIKPSARAVMEDADLLVTADESLSPAWVGSSRCGMILPATAVVLAGGRSTRMGTDKRFLRLQGLPLVERGYRQLRPYFAEVLISAREGEEVLPGVPHIADEEPGSGPIGAVASVLSRAAHERCLVAACDIPTIPMDLVQHMLRRARTHDVVVPVTPDGRHESLFAIYNRGTLSRLRELMRSGERRIRMLYPLVRTCRVEIPPGMLQNLNTREQFAAYSQTLASEQIQ